MAAKLVTCTVSNDESGHEISFGEHPHLSAPERMLRCVRAFPGNMPTGAISLILTLDVIKFLGSRQGNDAEAKELLDRFQLEPLLPDTKN